MNGHPLHVGSLPLSDGLEDRAQNVSAGAVGDLDLGDDVEDPGVKNILAGANTEHGPLPELPRV